jgi:uncharacterized UPF0160 family protein
MTANVVTHSGAFHADDAMAFAILVAAHGEITLVRTRDAEIIAAADVAFDVGNVFDPAARRFDHHMIDAPKRPDGTPYSSAGLIWREFGIQAIRTFVRENITDDEAEKIRDIVDQGIILEIDLIDNGIGKAGAGHVSDLIDSMNPTFIERASALKAGLSEAENQEAHFRNAAKIADRLLAAACGAALAEIKAVELVRIAAETADDPRILVLEAGVPSGSAIFSLGLDQVLYVIRPGRDEWTCSAVPPEPDSFAQRLPLPERWAGLRDVELAEASGIQDAVFCHKARFVCGARSKEGAIAMAQAAIRTGHSQRRENPNMTSKGKTLAKLLARDLVKAL